MKTRTSLLMILSTVIIPNAVARAGGPPCWDDISPTKIYAQRHVVNGGSSQLSADGLTVSAIRRESSDSIAIELSVTNCSSATVQALPNTYDLVVLGPGGPENDKRLARLDPTQFHHPNNPSRSAPALHSETLEYGRIGSYFLFFAPDTYYASMDHSERMSVVVGQWQFDFYFQKKRTH